MRVQRLGSPGSSLAAPAHIRNPSNREHRRCLRGVGVAHPQNNQNETSESRGKEERQGSPPPLPTDSPLVAVSPLAGLEEAARDAASDLAMLSCSDMGDVPSLSMSTQWQTPQRGGAFKRSFTAASTFFPSMQVAVEP